MKINDKYCKHRDAGNKTKVIHLISGLGKGGAETMLYQVLKYQVDYSIQYKVISLGESQYYEGLIENLNIPVVIVNFRNQPIYSIYKIYKEIKDCDALCCWMYYANLIGYFISKLYIKEKKKIIWNIRNGRLNSKYDKTLTICVSKLCSIVSRGVDVIAYNGNNARIVHEENGYYGGKSIVLNNFYDFEYYQPRPKIKIEKQYELFETNNNRAVFLSVARYNPVKDHATFFDTLAILKKKNIKFRAILCGLDVNRNNVNIVEKCRNNGLVIDDDVYLLDLRDDVNYLMNCCDLYILHSAVEAFPNTLAQAMASGCVSIATDVGNVKEILGDNFFIVPPENPLELASKIEHLLKLNESELKEIGIKNRHRIMKYYSIEKNVCEYEATYK